MGDYLWEIIYGRLFMGLIFSAKNIDECLEKASYILKLNKSNLKYNIIKEERKFFRKKVTIEIKNDNFENNMTQCNNDIFGAQVKNGKIIVNKFHNKEDIITIKSCEGVYLIFNGKKTSIIRGAKSTDNIEYIIEESPKAEKTLEISVSEDKMEAYISIKSIPQKIYKLEDCEPTNNLVLNKILIEEKYAEKYKLEDIKNALKEEKIEFGILEDSIKEICNKDNVSKQIVAKGIKPIDSIPESIEILFENYDCLKGKYNNKDKIDYRNRFMLASVKIGEEIAQIVPSKDGKCGKDIYGNDIKYKKYSCIKFKIGQGCKYENNKVISTVEGNPSFRENIFSVHKVYEVDQVDLTTGNINFLADVQVSKTVNDGMEVISGNTVFVGENVESANIKASRNIMVKGNIINSTLVAGDYSFNKKKYLLNLNYVKNIIHEIYSSIIQINKNNAFEGYNIGELIKLLLENKFKSLIPLCEEILEYCLTQGINDSPIKSFINNKLIGLGPINIHCQSELLDFIDLLSEESYELESFKSNDADIYAQYIQASKLDALGSIFIYGKGQYNSEIIALNTIEFMQENSVCRGGVISAGKEIKLKTVGSKSGGTTILKVLKDGIIIADIAYINTIFCIDNKEIILDSSSRNVRVYMDKMGDIKIDKLRL